MSAPKTNIEKQKTRHRAPLLGMGGVVAMTAVLLAIFLGWLALNGDDPDGADTQIDGRTGTVVEE